MTAKPIDTVFRDFVTEGVSASGAWRPKKNEVRDTLNQLFGFLTGSNAGALIFSTFASLSGNLAPADNTMAWVIGDADPDNDGVYEKTGAAGSGSWAKRAPLPYSVIHLNNAGAGTADAVVVTTAVGVPSAAYKALYVLNIIAANTGPVTVAINGGDAKPLVGNTGNELGAEYLQPGMAVLCVDDGTNLRMLSYGNADAVQAAAEAAADRAAEYAGALAIYPSQSEAAAATILLGTDRLQLRFYAPLAPQPSTMVGGGFWRRTTLAAITAAGILAPGYFQSADGAYWMLDEAKPHIEQLGAIRDADTDCSSAINAALSFGRSVQGTPGAIYGVSGNIECPAWVSIEDIAVKQLLPEVTNRRTWHSADNTFFRAKRCTVDRNGSGVNGDFQNDAAFWIDGGRVALRENEITGDGYGNGIFIQSADKVVARDNWVHDVTHGTAASADPGDDSFAGIRISQSSRVVVEGNVCENLLAQWSGQDPFPRYTRGFNDAGNERISYSNNFSSFVDQGFDFTGSYNPHKITVSACFAEDCTTWGFKASNTTKKLTYVGCHAERCGIAGFNASSANNVNRGTWATGTAYVIDDVVKVVDEFGLDVFYLALVDHTSGSDFSADLAAGDWMAFPLTSDIRYIGCWSIHSGYGNTTISLSDKAGFRVGAASFAGFPVNVRYIGCHAEGHPDGSMPYGFKNDANMQGGGVGMVTVDDGCVVINAATSNLIGIHYPHAKRNLTANQSIPDSAWTQVAYNATIRDGMASDGLGVASVQVREPGIYDVKPIVAWAGSSTGVRRVAIYKNDVQFENYLQFPSSGAGGCTTIGAWEVPCDTGDALDVYVYQNSGGALNVLGSGSPPLTTFSVTRRMVAM